jgi:hypothetical protein
MPLHGEERSLHPRVEVAALCSLMSLTPMAVSFPYPQRDLRQSPPRVTISMEDTALGFLHFFLIYPINEMLVPGTKCYNPSVPLNTSAQLPVCLMPRTSSLSCPSWSQDDDVF